uniref:Protein kinase domain-containing protein n=1 Tax=Leersia perrieri TaxID=77586 RepID=A0A0D9XZJ7_9ORYZ
MSITTPLSFPSSTPAVNHGDPAASGESAAALWEYGVDELKAATWGFDGARRLGQGQTGVVFRGTLLGHDGVVVDVAVKRFHDVLTEEKMRLARRDFRGRRFLQDRNVVRLHGYACPNTYSPEAGTLAILSWDCRSKIITGAAQGLYHYHSHGTVHGCVTASNILIENDFTARLFDFGYSWSRLSRCHLSSSPSTMSISTVKMSSEMDVLCFGTVILEVVSGRRSSELPTGANGFKLLVDWVWALHEKGCILDAVDTTLGITAANDNQQCLGMLSRDAAEAKKMLLVGLACSHPDPKLRPKIGDK